MALAPSDLISQLSNNQNSSQDRIAAGRRIKNALVGNPENKEIFVRHGLVDALSSVLTSEGNRQEDEALQTISLVRGLIKGGPEYVAPILASSLIAELPPLLSPSSNSHRMVIGILRLLLDLAETSRHASPTAESFQQSASLDLLYTQLVLQSFAEILSQQEYSKEAEKEVALVCRFITETCKTSQQKAALTAAGILDCLAARIASYHAHEVTRSSRTSTLSGFVFPPSPDDVSSVLRASRAVVSGSEYRSARFLSSPLMNLVFPRYQPEPFHLSRPTTSVDETRGLDINRLEYNLPQIDPMLKSEAKTFSNPFPSVGIVKARVTATMFDFMQASQENGASDPSEYAKRHQGESSFVTWLLITFRTNRDDLRLQAASLLASLRQDGQVSKFRDRLLSMVMIPVLKTMVDYALGQSASKNRSATIGVPYSDILEQVPIIMAQLIKGKTYMSSVAVEVGAVEQASTLLKATYFPLPTSQATWQAPPSSDDTAMIDDMPATRRLGTPGLNMIYVHFMRRREAALKMVTSLADEEDKYRKQFLSEPLAIGTALKDSLLPFDPEKYQACLDPRNNDTFKPATIGHDVPVLIAACEALRMFSRSVTLLRTGLLESGMAKPVVSLLRHPNAVVSRNATEVCVNISNEFSPMREELCTNQQNFTLLCEHAHSANSHTSHVSLMALKNLCNKAPHDIKVKAFEKLETGWLIKRIRGRPARSSNPVPSLNMGGNAAGERVDILNAPAPEDVMDLEIDDGSISSEGPSSSSTGADEFAVPETLLARLMPSADTSFDSATLISQYKTHVSRLHEHSQNMAASEAYAVELMRQVGGFDFIRNLTQGDDNIQMLNMVFREIGDAALFDILYSKLKSPASSSTGGVPLGPSARAISPHPACIAIEVAASRALIRSALGVLIHIAAGTSSNRQQLISNRSLILALQPLLDHSDPEIRANILWIIINLTYVDNINDTNSAGQRAQQLRGMGWVEKLRDMKDSDEAVNVRERASTAYEQLRGMDTDTRGSRTGEGTVRRAGDMSFMANSWGSTRG